MQKIDVKKLYRRLSAAICYVLVGVVTFGIAANADSIAETAATWYRTACKGIYAFPVSDSGTADIYIDGDKLAAHLIALEEALEYTEGEAVSSKNEAGIENSLQAIRSDLFAIAKAMNDPQKGFPALSDDTYLTERTVKNAEIRNYIDVALADDKVPYNKLVISEANMAILGNASSTIAQLLPIAKEIYVKHPFMMEAQTLVDMANLWTVYEAHYSVNDDYKYDRRISGWNYENGKVTGAKGKSKSKMVEHGYNSWDSKKFTQIDANTIVEYNGSFYRAVGGAGKATVWVDKNYATGDYVKMKQSDGSYKYYCAINNIIGNYEWNNYTNYVDGDVVIINDGGTVKYYRASSNVGQKSLFAKSDGWTEINIPSPNNDKVNWEEVTDAGAISEIPEWTSKEYKEGAVVRVNSNCYQAKQDIPKADSFDVSQGWVAKNLTPPNISCQWEEIISVPDTLIFNDVSKWTGMLTSSPAP